MITKDIYEQYIYKYHRKDNMIRNGIMGIERAKSRRFEPELLLVLFCSASLCINFSLNLKSFSVHIFYVRTNNKLQKVALR